MKHALTGTTAEAVLLAAAFAVAHTQAPLYYSNQNQYLLHGLAAGGLGHLSADWLANTRDPTPVFSALVAAGYRAFGEWSFQAAYFLLLMGYFLIARWLVGALPGVPDTRALRLAWAAAFTAAHAAILRLTSVQLTGVDYPWYLQSGVAGQYLLGPGLQPSAFGVLLLAAVAAFANGRPFLAAALAAGAAVFHATYLLPAGLLALGFLAALAVAGRTRTAVVAGAVALVVVAPVVAYVLVGFSPSSADSFGEAHRILVEVRIPHHAVIARWLDEVAWAQVAWVAAGIALLRRSPLFLALLVFAAGGLALTLVQAATADPTLALLFPWRVSAVLVPVATAVILARLCALPTDRPEPTASSSPPPLRGRSASGASRVGGERREETPHPDPPPQGGREQEGHPPSHGGREQEVRRIIAIISVIVLGALVVGGVVVMVNRLGYRMSDDEEPLYAFVRVTAKPRDVYLLPVRIPAVGGGRGSVSTSFTPPPRPKPGSNLIPVDLQRFRLHTGAPIYVDFKSVPYADAEVLEWYRRLKVVEDWYEEPNWDAPGMREALVREGVTHVVAPRGREPRAGYLEQVHADPAYVVFRMK